MKNWGPGVDFKNSRFFADVELVNISFSGKVNFLNAKFSEFLNIENANFHDSVIFKDADFYKDARFLKSKFLSNANFNGSFFAKSAIFSNTKFFKSAGFFQTCFVGAARFNGSVFNGSVVFSESLFFGGLHLQREAASAQAIGRLVRGADENKALEAVSNNPNAMDYILVSTQGRAKRETGAFQTLNLSDSWCLGVVDFSDRVFSKAPSFQQARLAGPPQFFQSELHDGVNLMGAEFRFDEGARPISWESIFKKLCNRPRFVSVEAQTQASDQSVLKSIWLNDQTRRSLFQESVKPEGQGHKEVNPLWRSAFIAWREYALRLPHSDRLKDPTGMNWSDSSRKKRLAAAAEDAPQFEQAYRRLKLLMSGMGAHIEEQRFFACELRARQARRPETDTDIKFGEPSVAALYGLIADYGRSFVRPLWGLLAVWMLTSLLYVGLLQGVHEPTANSISLTRPPGLNEPYEVPSLSDRFKEHLDSERQRWRAKAYVFSQIAGPMVFAAEITLAPVANPIRHHPWAMAVNEAGPGWSAAFSLLRLIHRILALPLIFLFALALRRRFQLG